MRSLESDTNFRTVEGESSEPELRIVVVEDNADDQDLLVRNLWKAKLRKKTLLVNHGDKALEFFSAEQSNLRTLIIIFLDLKLPGKSGLEILDHIRSQPALKTLPVFVVTASLDPLDEQKCQLSKATGYLRKPLDFKSFSSAISTFLPMTNGSSPAKI